LSTKVPVYKKSEGRNFFSGESKKEKGKKRNIKDYWGLSFQKSYVEAW